MKTSSRVIAFVGLGVAGLMAAASTPAAAKSAANCIKPDAKFALPAKAKCLRPAEQTAVQMRLLQTDLMVAALSCHRKPDYNAFVTKHRDVLIQSGRQLRALFHRVHGNSATPALNSYVTKLANSASMQSLNGDDYCGRMGKLFDGVLTVSPVSFTAFVATFSATGDVAAAKLQALQSEQAELTKK